jgi:hypothetical protein
MTMLAFIVRMLGLPLCIFIGMLGYYEGVPALRDIPFAAFRLYARLSPVGFQPSAPKPRAKPARGLSFSPKRRP